jgi:3-carboxy-cis,cis-muconate cycloisomerase
MSTVFESVLFRDMFGTPDMREVFDDQAYLRAVVRAEVALAEAQARVGVIPREAADVIAAEAEPSRLDLAALERETEVVGYPILPVVTQLAQQCGEAGGYVHWGATTQDIMDTATVLQVRDALQLVEHGLLRTRQALRHLAGEHIDTVTAGRTHLQHALPVTFGYRCAVWLSALDRHAERLEQVRERALLLQLGGAAGTLASLGGDGLRVRAAYAEVLGLREPDITWHVARDGLAEVVQLLALIGGTLGKVAWDVMMMASSEFGEVAEPFVDGRGASSTMPQKRNPISSELMFAAAKLLRERAGSMLDALVQDFERATGPWHVEWATVPEAFLLVATSLSQAESLLDGLVVHPERMRRNLDLTGGLIVAERVMMELAPELGRQRAHEVVYDACRAAIESGTTLADQLLADDDLHGRLGEERIRALIDPAGYLGSAREMTRRVIDRAARSS